MRLKNWNRQAMDWFGAMMFAGLHRTIWRKHARGLFLALFIGAMSCVAFGAVLLTLNRQGRI